MLLKFVDGFYDRLVLAFFLRDVCVCETAPDVKTEHS